MVNSVLSTCNKLPAKLTHYPLLPNQRLHLQREVCFLLRPMLKPRTKKAKSTGIRTDRSNKLRRGARS